MAEPEYQIKIRTEPVFPECFKKVRREHLRLAYKYENAVQSAKEFLTTPQFKGEDVVWVGVFTNDKSNTLVFRIFIYEGA